MTTITQLGSLGEQKPTEPPTVHTVQGGGGLRAARARVGQGGRTADPAHPRHFRKPARAAEYQSKLAKETGWWPTTRAATACPRHRAGALHQRQAVGRRRGRHQQLGLERPVPVGRSYGGYIICDYLRAHGQDRIGAIDFAGGATKLGPVFFGTPITQASSTRPFRRLHRRRPADQHPRHAASVAAFAATPPPPTSRRCCAQPRTVPARRPTGAARSTTATRRAGCGCRCWSARAGRTPWCSRRWPSTSWPPARPPRPPGTGAAGHAVPGGPRALQPRTGRAGPLFKSSSSTQVELVYRTSFRAREGGRPAAVEDLYASSTQSATPPLTWERKILMAPLAVNGAEPTTRYGAAGRRCR